MVDAALFTYLTRKSGHSLDDAALAMGLPRSSLSSRLRGSCEFRASEMEAWMRLVGVEDAGPVFFPALVAEKQQSLVEGNG